MTKPLGVIYAIGIGGVNSSPTTALSAVSQLSKVIWIQSASKGIFPVSQIRM